MSDTDTGRAKTRRPSRRPGRAAAAPTDAAPREEGGRARPNGQRPNGPRRRPERAEGGEGGERSGAPRGRRRGGKGKPNAGGQNAPRERRPVMPDVEPSDPSAFAPLGINDEFLRRIGQLGYTTPTPIQSQAIPVAFQGRDLVGLAQTGTGKTAAFGLPLAQRLMEARRDGAPAPRARAVSALILAPTRELATQIADSLRLFTMDMPFRVVTVVGGQSINRQADMLARGADILVATPGRLLDLIERRAVHLNDTTELVLDEADQMLDLGFIHDLKRIASLVAEPRRTWLFSATMPREVAELAKRFVHDPVRVEVSPPGKAADKVRQQVHFVSMKDKPDLLTSMLQDALFADKDARALVFCRTKHGAERLMKRLRGEGLEAASIHGNKSQNQRDRALDEFRAGRTNVLVATDVAARGIDIPAVTHVYNYELPQVAEAYVHRIGRTARAGREGLAVALCDAEEYGLLLAIERLTGVPLETIGGTRPERAVKAPKKGRGPGGRGAPRSGGRPRPAEGERKGGQRPRRAQGRNARQGKRPAA